MTDIDKQRKGTTMPLIVKRVDRYLIDYIGGPSLQGGTAGAIITCFSATPHAGGIGFTPVGTVTFFADSRVLPANQYLPDETIALYYEMSRFNDVVGIFRYSEPLQIAVNTETGYGYLGNAQTEDVGQQEGV